MRTLVGAAEPEDPPPSGPQVTLSTGTSSTTSAIIVWRQPAMDFVCGPCKSGDHTTCDPRHCDCQHKGK